MSYDETTGDTFVAGTTFAGVVIERELGRGGAGVVYLARDQQLDRLVALKVLHRHSMGDDPAALDRFRNEAVIAAKLEHPSIIPIYSSGVDRGLAYLVMRYVPGRNLASYLNEAAPMEVDAAIRLLRPVAVALDYAAEFNVVHRDVKPANIFVDESGSQPRALLGDFGIARAYEGTRHTATGGWVGTPDYIAPEVLKDEQATTRADQYSLACVLVECLTGVSPFKRSNTAATITAQVTETPDFESLVNVSPRVADALSVALEKNPDDRYTSCTEFLDAIATSATGDASTTPATIVRRRKRSKAKRRAKIIGTVVVTTLGLLLGIAQITGFNVREWRSGGSEGARADTSASSAASEPQAETPTEKRPDVLILGSTLADWSDWKPKQGVTLPDIVIDALAQNPKTIDFSTKAIPMKAAENCAADVKAAQASMPQRAIVVLETPCSELIVKLLGAKDVAAPPIYLLTPRWPDTDTARAFMIHVPSAQYPKVDPSIELSYGKIDTTRFVPLQLPLTLMFEGGVVARHYGATRCTYFSDSGTYGEALQPGIVEVGLLGPSASDDHVVAAVYLPAESVAPGFLRDATANTDCIIAPVNGFAGRPDAIVALKSAVEASRNKLFVLLELGSPGFQKWAEQQPNVISVSTYGWLPIGPAQDRFRTVGDATIRGWGKASPYDDRAALFYVTDLIANMSAAAPKGQIPTSAWIPDTQAEKPESGYSYSYAPTGVAPTPWGFVTGYETSIMNRGDEFGYVGGTMDPDLSGAPSPNVLTNAGSG